MIAGLIIILLMVFLLPFTIKLIEHNLEYFLFLMGFAAVIVSGALSKDLLSGILTNQFLYFITGAVLIAGLLFHFLADKLEMGINAILKIIPLKVFVFLVVVVLGFASSFITAIIASLVLVEIINALPITRNNKIKLAVVSCFSIGLGAVLTPIGEPLATIVVSKIDADFWFLLNQLGIYIVPGILALGIFGAYFVRQEVPVKSVASALKTCETENEYVLGNGDDSDKDSKISEVLIRAFKIFVFIFALELLGAGFKLLIDTYVIQLSSKLLYWINMVSAILDNATLAAAEISDSMSILQVKAVLMGLLISGGMLIPGNIPNIVAAGKLKIQSREWAKIGMPIGLIIMLIYFVIIFFI